MLDSDRAENDINERSNANLLALENNILIIWQQPSHEAFLIRHLQGCAQLRPSTTGLADSRLLEKWPNYRKPMNRIQVAREINAGRVQQAATVEPELRSFLTDIGWG